MIFKKFKEGDLVYWPEMGPFINILILNPEKDSDYPLCIDFNDRYDDEKSYYGSFDYYGKYCNEYAPSLIHATSTNKNLLESLYGLEFESPINYEKY